MRERFQYIFVGVLLCCLTAWASWTPTVTCVDSLLRSPSYETTFCEAPSYCGVYLELSTEISWSDEGSFSFRIRDGDLLLSATAVPTINLTLLTELQNTTTPALRCSPSFRAEVISPPLNTSWGAHVELFGKGGGPATMTVSLTPTDPASVWGEIVSELSIRIVPMDLLEDCFPGSNSSMKLKFIYRSSSPSLIYTNTSNTTNLSSCPVMRYQTSKCRAGRSPRPESSLSCTGDQPLQCVRGVAGDTTRQQSTFLVKCKDAVVVDAWDCSQEETSQLSDRWQGYCLLNATDLPRVGPCNTSCVVHKSPPAIWQFILLLTAVAGLFAVLLVSPCVHNWRTMKLFDLMAYYKRMHFLLLVMGISAAAATTALAIVTTMYKPYFMWSVIFMLPSVAASTMALSNTQPTNCCCLTSVARKYIFLLNILGCIGTLAAVAIHLAMVSQIEDECSRHYRMFPECASRFEAWKYPAYVTTFSAFTIGVACTFMSRRVWRDFVQATAYQFVDFSGTTDPRLLDLARGRGSNVYNTVTTVERIQVGVQLAATSPTFVDRTFYSRIIVCFFVSLLELIILVAAIVFLVGCPTKGPVRQRANTAFGLLIASCILSIISGSLHMLKYFRTFRMWIQNSSVTISATTEFIAFVIGIPAAVLMFKFNQAICVAIIILEIIRVALARWHQRSRVRSCAVTPIPAVPLQIYNAENELLSIHSHSRVTSSSIVEGTVGGVVPTLSDMTSRYSSYPSSRVPTSAPTTTWTSYNDNLSTHTPYLSRMTDNMDEEEAVLHEPRPLDQDNTIHSQQENDAPLNLRVEAETVTPLNPLDRLHPITCPVPSPSESSPSLPAQPTGQLTTPQRSSPQAEGSEDRRRPRFIFEASREDEPKLSLEAMRPVNAV